MYVVFPLSPVCLHLCIDTTAPYPSRDALMKWPPPAAIHHVIMKRCSHHAPQHAPNSITSNYSRALDLYSVVGMIIWRGFRGEGCPNASILEEFGNIASIFGYVVATKQYGVGSVWHILELFIWKLIQYLAFCLLWIVYHKNKSLIWENVAGLDANGIHVLCLKWWYVRYVYEEWEP